MGMLVTISRRASAFRTAQGVFYALFETTYPKNHPDPRPTSQCVAFGTFAHIARWIFGAMAACESGLLQGANGPLDPLDYWRFWQHALRRPDPLFTQPIWISASRNTRAAIPVDSDVWYDGNRLPFAVRVMRQHGYPALAARVEAGEEIILDLHRDAAVLADIYGGVNDVRIEPWRIIECGGMGEGDPSLAPVPGAPVQGHHSAVSIFRLGTSNRLCALIRGRSALIGTRDELLHDFISRVACDMELHRAGAGIRAIQVFREALSGTQEAFALPGNVTCVIHKERLLGMALFRRRYEAIEMALGRRARHVEFGIKVSVSTLRALDLLTAVADLPSVCLDFRPATARKTPLPARPAALAA